MPGRRDIPSPTGVSRRYARRRSASCLAVALFFAFEFTVASASHATTFTYTATTSSTDQWSAGTHWSATPVSNSATQLSYNGSSPYKSITNTNTDNIAGAFLLNILDLSGSGDTTGGGSSITIAASGGSSLDFVSNGPTTPQINLTGSAGHGMTYNVSAPITFSNNTLFNGSGSATFNFTGAITLGASSIQLSTNSTNVVTLGGAVTGTSNLTVSTTVAGGFTFSGNVNNAGTITNSGSGAGTTTISGNIGSNVTGVTENSSTSKLILSGSNGSFSSGLNVTAGTVQASGANTNVFGTGTVTVGSTGVLDINGTSQSTGLLSGVAGASVTNSVASPQTLTLSGAGSQTFGGVIGGGANLALTLSGGTQTLTGTNTYTGATTVSGGTLFVNGSTASGSAVTVNNSGTLSGSGTVNGTVNVTGSGAKINPGATAGVIGTLNTGALTLQNSSVFNVDMTSGSGNADQLNVVGTVSLLTNPTLNLNFLTGTHFAPGNAYVLINNDGIDAINGTFANAPAGLDTIDGFEFIVSYTGGTGNDFTLTAVPEPSTWVAGTLALGALIVIQRRRISRLVRRA